MHPLEVSPPWWIDPKIAPYPLHHVFHNFPLLPSEIQFLIWSLALPSPRSIQGALPFILNTTYAILPSIQDMAHAFHNPYAVSRSQHEGFDTEHTQLMETLERSMTQWRAILSLLHTCPTSRDIARQRYRLDFSSIVEAENTPLWTEDDIVYFPWLGINLTTLRANIDFFFQERSEPRPSLASLQHPAFLFRREVVRSLNLEPTKPPAEYAWAKNFPSLESFSLFLDPLKVGFYDSGRVILWEPEEVKVEDVYMLTPRQIVQRMTVGLRREGMEEEDVPLVETFVATVRGMKKQTAIADEDY
jgi:hypothetical protein